MRKILLLFCLFSFVCYAQDTTYLKVHFLYGSRPLKKYRHIEKKWFGGVWGGHVGVESNEGEILNFLPSGKFHWFAQSKNRHSTYALHSHHGFYAILGGDPFEVKKAVVLIPLTPAQKEKFDSIARAYLGDVPYDYALIGMRCAAATYDILDQLGIMPDYSYGKTYRRIFYPRILRKRLFRKARQHNWTILRQDGSGTRKWDWD